MDHVMARARDALAATTRLLSGRDIVVTQQGAEAFVEFDPDTFRPRRINVPLLPDDADPALVAAAQGYVDHEVGHLLFTDWEVVARASALGLRSSYNIVEDTFIERMMGERFPGAKSNLARLRDLLCVDYVPTMLEEAGDDQARFGVLLVQAARAMAGQDGPRRFMDEGGHWDGPRMRSFVDLLGEEVVSRVPTLASSSECLEVAERWAAAASEASGRRGGASVGIAAPSEADEDEQGPSDVSDAGDRVVGQGAATAAGAAGGRPSPPPRAGDGDERGGGDERDAAVGRDASCGDGTDHAAPSSGDPPGLAHDPFGSAAARTVSHAAARAIAAASYRVFSREGDRIEAPELPAAYRNEWLEELERITAGMAGAMRRDIERMMAAESRSARVLGLESGQIRPASLHRLAVGDGRVFQRRLDAPTKDTAVTLLVDNSGSMRGERILVAMAAAYALATTLERVAIPCEALGYTTDERLIHWAEALAEGNCRSFSRYAAILMPVFKPFSQRLTPSNRRRFAVAAMAESYMGANVDGESLQYAAMRLLPRRERRRVMIVISDGTPAVRRGNGGDLEAHLERTVASLVRTGVEVVGIGIGTDAVRRFYPRSLVIDELGQLPGAVMGELRRILSA